jgi:hypothetical protein
MKSTMDQENNEAVALSSHAKSNNYVQIQFKVSVVVFSFWIFLFLIFWFKQIIYSFVNHFLILFLRRFFQTPKLVRLKSYLKRIGNIFLQFEIRYLRNSIRSFNRSLSGFTNLFFTQTSKVFSLRLIISNKIKSVFVFIVNIRRSVKYGICSFNIYLKQLVLIPVRAKRSFLIFSNQIRTFWLQIEQIIQIVRLPIEILGMIGRFIKTVALFLKRLEKPKLQ